MNKTKFTHDVFTTSRAIFLVSFLICTVQIAMHQDVILLGNEGAHVKLLYNMAHHNTLDIRGIIDGELLPHSYIKPDYSLYNNIPYSNKPPGYSFFLYPFYWVFVAIFGFKSAASTILFMKIASAAFSSASMVLMYLILRLYISSNAHALLGVTAAGLGTIYPAYSVLANSIPFSLLLLSASLFLYSYSRLYSKSPWHDLAILLLCNYSIITDYANIFFALPLIILSLYRLAVHQKYWMIPASCITLAPLCIYNSIVFDSLFASTYAHYEPPSYITWTGAGNSFSLQRLPHGLYNLLFNTGRGLLFISPISLASIWVLIRHYKRLPQTAFVIASMFLSGLLFISCYEFWHGGHSVGYRHILLVSVFLCLLSAFFLEYAKPKIIAYRAWGCIFAVSILTGVASFLIHINAPVLKATWKLEPLDIHSNFYTELIPMVLKKLHVLPLFH